LRDDLSAEWAQLFYENGSVNPQWRSTFRAWGTTPQMQALEIDYARTRFWEPAMRTAARLKFTSTRAKAFLFDTSVQNGGWSGRHDLALQRIAAPVASEPERLQQMAHAVAACANPRWQQDVLSRKLLFASGYGTVHGQQLLLANFGL
jgi:hypothetical protein